MGRWMNRWMDRWMDERMDPVIEVLVSTYEYLVWNSKSRLEDANWHYEWLCSKCIILPCALFSNSCRRKIRVIRHEKVRRKTNGECFVNVAVCWRHCKIGRMPRRELCHSLVRLLKRLHRFTCSVAQFFCVFVSLQEVLSVRPLLHRTLVWYCMKLAQSIHGHESLSHELRSEWASERMSATERKGAQRSALAKWVVQGMSKWRSEWPNTLRWFHMLCTKCASVRLLIHPSIALSVHRSIVHPLVHFLDAAKKLVWYGTSWWWQVLGYQTCCLWK